MTARLRVYVKTHNRWYRIYVPGMHPLYVITRLKPLRASQPGVIQRQWVVSEIYNDHNEPERVLRQFGNNLKGAIAWAKREMLLRCTRRMLGEGPEVVQLS